VAISKITMRWVLIGIVLLLSACTQQTIQDLPSEPPADLSNNEENLIAIANLTGEQNTTEQFSPNETVNESQIEVITNQTIEIPKEAPVLSYTEQAESYYLEHNPQMVYMIQDEQFGQLWVYHFRHRTKYTGPERLFEYDKDTNSIKLSVWYNTATDPSFKEKVEERRLPVLNYIWLENGTYGGCYVWTGYYRKERCIQDNTSSRTPIIYEDFEFNPPLSPLAWLQKYHGQEPKEIRYNFTYKDTGNMLHKVDQAFFANDDGTTSILYVHQGYKVPLRVDILGPDRKLQKKILFEFFTTDLSYIEREYAFFIDD
jgi:hypothetical protein